MKITLAKGVMLIMVLLSVLTGCLLDGPKTETGEYRIDNVRIYQDTPAWELAQAVNRQDVRRIAQIAENNPEVLNYQDPLYGTTLLFWTIGMEKYNSAEALLKAGADPDIISTYEGGTALYRAAGFSFIDSRAKKDAIFVRLLLNYGADPNIGYVGNDRNNTPEIGTTPLMASIGCGIEKTKALVEAGAEINFRTESGSTAAIEALMSGGPNRTIEMLEYARYLIVDHKADVTRPYYHIRYYRNDNPDDEFFPVDLLRNWIYPLDSEYHIIKLEITEEFARQGVDYWSTEITQHQLYQIKNKYPDTWEEYIKRY